MKKIFIGLILIISLAVIGYLIWGGNKEQDNQTQSAGQEDSSKASSEKVIEDPNLKYYTAEDVAQYGFNQYDLGISPEDFQCWTIIHDKVYDITPFLIDHPGGESIHEACGVDGTKLFETREIGSGTPHSENARNILDKYYIGELKK